MARTTNLTRLLLKKLLSTDVDDFLHMRDSANNLKFAVSKDGAITTAVPLVSSLLDPTLVQYASVALTAAQMLALFTTAVALVAAPGANKVLEFIRATISYVFVTTAYTINGSTNLSVAYKDKTGANVSTTLATTGFIDQVVNEFSMFQPLVAQLTLDANAVNQPLCLKLITANPTLGDGTFKVDIVYRVHTLL